MNKIYQYNEIAKDFSSIHQDGNKYSNQAFYGTVDKFLKGKKILDIGCGDGKDLLHYKSKGADAFGIDASMELLSIAQKIFGTEKVKQGFLDLIPFDSEVFDVVLSKYALQTIEQFDDFYNEAHRVLKSDGILVFLAVHPMRQFFEKKTRHKDYFEQTIVDSSLFHNTLIVQEPTHTMQQYLSDTFFKKFTLVDFIEKDDFYSAEKIGEYTYPTYMIVKAIKK
jgi:ubiquinone/menaquinone biosynthesis C-methylase UbiE